MRDLGEGEYMRRARNEALAWIGTYPAGFLRLTLMRFLHLGRAAFLIPLATFPLICYAVSYVAHYPAPLSWLLLLLAGHDVQSRISRDSKNRADPAEPPDTA